MGWQLATGRYVVQHHQIPSTDVLSFTSAGEPWVYPPFAGVLFYLTYCAFGYAGLSWFSALACLAVVAYLARRGDLGSAVLAMLAVQSIAARTAPRADLFSTVFFAFFLYLDSGSDSTSALIAYLYSDYYSGLPITPNGGNITISWSATGNLIFSL